MCFLTRFRTIFVLLLFFNFIWGLQYIVVVTHDNDTICYDDTDECEWSIISDASSTPNQRVPLNVYVLH